MAGTGWRSDSVPFREVISRRRRSRPRRNREPQLSRFASGWDAHFGFGIDAQRVGHAVDVIEIGNDFNGVQDVAVAEAVFAKTVNMLLANRGGSACDELGESCQGLASGRKPGAPIVVFDLFGQPCVAA